VQPSPHKRPKSSYIRFAAEQPNERWQADFTHWHLANGAHIEILCWIDDHSRYALSVTAHPRVTGPMCSIPSAKPMQHMASRHPRGLWCLVVRCLCSGTWSQPGVWTPA
jgi:hypothetical protein